MSGLAVLAKALGHEVSGSDMNIYPPMSTQLASQGISLKEGYDPQHIDASIDLVIIGNVIKRGNPAIDPHRPEFSASRYLKAALRFLRPLSDRGFRRFGGRQDRRGAFEIVSPNFRHA